MDQSVGICEGVSGLVESWPVLPSIWLVLLLVSEIHEGLKILFWQVFEADNRA